MSKKTVLLKTLLLSTSQKNILKYCKDKKKRSKIIGGYIGMGILYLMLIAYCVLQSIGFGYFGLAGSIPVMCALIISLLSFFFTVFKTNGYLFNFKEYDMLMSLPFKPKDIAGCKFLYMYIKALPWQQSVSLSMMAVYGYYAKASVLVYPVWIVLSLFLPIIPTLIASFIGYLIAKVSSGFRNKTIVPTILSFLVVLLGFGARFFLEDMFKEGKTGEVLSSISSITESISRVYLPASWFDNAVKDLSISDILLLIGVSVLLFELVFIPVGHSYRKINSALKSHGASKKTAKQKSRQRSPLNAIVFKEFKRMTGSTVYMTNGPIGELICLLIGIALIFIDIDSLLFGGNAAGNVAEASINKDMLYPLIPFIVYFFVGMVATTAYTPSLEGKNFWIVQSLPIPKKTLYRGKMLFNMYLTAPVSLFTITTACISAKIPVITSILFLILGFMLCAFSTTWGCICGIKHMRLDWENEIEAIKQGSAVVLYLFPNILVCFILIGASIALGTVLESNVIALIMIALVTFITWLNYRKVMKLCA